MGLRGPLERMLTVDQVHVLRHKVLVEGRSQRQVATELGISRRTVRKYLTEPVPIRREAHPRARPVWTRVQARVDTLLAESAQWTGGKQQLTATRLHELLRAEGHHSLFAREQAEQFVARVAVGRAVDHHERTR